MILKERVSAALRTCGDVADAIFVDSPVEEGKMRLLFTANAKVMCVDVPAFPVLPATGNA
jgi:hypothetical protein